MSTIGPSSFAELLRAGTRFIDVRAPVEFAEGSIPGSINQPILTDEERHLVGRTYKEKGPQAAIALGHELVSGAVREARELSWIQELERSPDALLLCFRGGLRSRTAQSWLSERGLARPIIEGGYKALRRFLIQVLREEPARRRFRVVRGPTGSGKTRYLRSQGVSYLDLEELARHRGSAFGAFEVPQPSQVDFENAIAVELLRARPGDEILIESESRMIGSRTVPEELFLRMRESPTLELRVDLETRVENILQDYIVASTLIRSGNPARFDEFERAVGAITRKLGGARAAEVLRDLRESRVAFVEGRGLEPNRVWIRKLLEWYYDPLYARSGPSRGG